jgi:hypothetical protein
LLENITEFGFVLPKFRGCRCGGGYGSNGYARCAKWMVSVRIVADLFGQEHRTGKLRCEGFSGGKVRKAPAKIIVLIVTAAWKVLVFDTAMACSSKRRPRPPGGTTISNVIRALAGDLYCAGPAFVAAGHGGLRETPLPHREQIRLTSLGLFKATQIWALHRTQRAINAGIGGVGRSTTRWQTRSLRVHRARNCANACSRLTAYPRSLNHGGLRSLAMITQNQGASIGACGWRTIRPMTLSPSHTS